MNLDQLTRLRNDLLTARANIDVAIIEVRLATEVLLATEAMPAPDAGLVVVSQPYCMWMSVTDYGLFCEWDYRWMVADGWRYTGCRIVFAASGWMSHEVNISPSHLTIAAGRGEGMATRDILGGMMISENVWAGPSGYATWAWWDSQLGDAFPWAYNHDHHASIVQRWHPDESTTLDCAAVPHAMTWRAV